MNRTTLYRTLVAAMVVLVVAGVLVAKQRRGNRPSPGAVSPPGAAAVAAITDPAARPGARGAALPLLVDVGSTKCRACKEMEVVLAQLREEYAGRLTVDFVDVFSEPARAEPFKVSIIPTQILYDASGRELVRHIGFWSVADIAKAYAAKGVRL